MSMIPTVEDELNYLRESCESSHELFTASEQEARVLRARVAELEARENDPMVHRILCDGSQRAHESIIKAQLANNIQAEFVAVSRQLELAKACYEQIRWESARLPMQKQIADLEESLAYVKGRRDASR